jgi:hypothetical protein
MQCVETSHFEVNCHLDWGFAVLNETGFFYQPSNVVLLVMERAQLPRVRQPAMISTHGVMIAAMCSSRLLDAQNLRCG